MRPSPARCSASRRLSVLRPPGLCTAGTSQHMLCARWQQWRRAGGLSQTTGRDGVRSIWHRVSGRSQPKARATPFQRDRGYIPPPSPIDPPCCRRCSRQIGRSLRRFSPNHQRLSPLGERVPLKAVHMATRRDHGSGCRMDCSRPYGTPTHVIRRRPTGCGHHDRPRDDPPLDPSRRTGSHVGPKRGSPGAAGHTESGRASPLRSSARMCAASVVSSRTLVWNAGPRGCSGCSHRS